ncbi:hypothetical protein D3OALGA1CA_3330 [Olavius algarvensis associated proteobacterium Delta 3]|nr:hypothetical protein D3OALGB2SA_1454 [Olavius algarvensis associated proteobacterium Delta 3]CAB5132669.1 hypothetical protein D3OALGA1CA_3330 [Olavius algarvensis associated proteobacterium Delta 3]
MIPQIKEILYATDLSKNARFAFGYAASLANSVGARITILHVLEEPSRSAAIRLESLLGEERWRDLQSRNEQDVLDTVKARLETFCDDMKKELVSCPFIVKGVLVKQGDPAVEILDEADTGNYDLAVMGTHGQGVLAQAMVGSTARRVVRMSRTPVMVIRLPDDA